MPSLFVIQGQDQGKRFDLDKICTTVGRDTINHVRLNDGETSRQHAEIRQDDLGESFYLTDLGSSNGTYVNGKLVERHLLENGDRVQFGSTLAIYTGDDAGGARSTFDNVDIVASQQDASQIVAALPHDENSQFFYADAEEQDSPWLARARSNLQVMYRTALAVSHTMDIDELLERIMELIFEWVEADRGCILMKDEATGNVTPHVHRNRPGVKTDEKITISQTIVDYVMTKSEGVLTSDARDDERFDAAGSIVKMGVREAICVPMQGRYGVVGLIYIDTYTPPGDWTGSTSNKFTNEHLKMMIAIAHQAALAIEDTSYYSAMLQSERLAAIGQTIAGLSHHVKNILQGIRGGSYLIEEGLNVSETELVRKGWGIVEKNQEMISRLVLDMLTFSKEREPEVVDADLHKTISDVVELIDSRAIECGVAIEYENDASIPLLRFDQEGIHHALLNVVGNAVDACESAWLNLPDDVDIESRFDNEPEDIGTVETNLEEPASDEQNKSDESQDTDDAPSAEEAETDEMAALAAEVARTANQSAKSLDRFAKEVQEDSNEDEEAEWQLEEDDILELDEEDSGEEDSDEEDSDEEDSDETDESAESADEETSLADEADANEEELENKDSDSEEEATGEDDEQASDETDDHSEDEEESEEKSSKASDEEASDEEASDEEASDEDKADDEEASGDDVVAQDDTADNEEAADPFDTALANLTEDGFPERGSRGTVTITTRYQADNRSVEIEVKDNGEGIDDQNLRQIFTIFNSTKGKRGTGLGLSVSQKILHEHGGDIRVESQRGAGSTFTLVLPAIPAARDEKDGDESNEGLEQEADGSTAAHDLNT